MSRSNVVIASAGTTILLTAMTSDGPVQTYVPVLAQGRSARFADPTSVANWVAAGNATAPVSSVKAALSGIEYVQQVGVNAITIDVLADAGAITLLTDTHTSYTPPGTITPTPGPR